MCLDFFMLKGCNLEVTVFESQETGSPLLFYRNYLMIIIIIFLKSVPVYITECQRQSS